MEAEWTNADNLTPSETTGKAILVINQMPDSCYDCKYCQFDVRKYNFRGCILTDTEVQDGTIDICKEVHSCCPLKPLPQEQDIYENGMDEEDTNAKRQWNKGWNACIKELEK